VIDDKYDKLTVRDKEAFSAIVNKLLRSNYILREIYSSKDQEMKINYDFSFLERHYSLVEDYLEIGGWRLHKDSRFGVIYVDSIYDYNRHRIYKFATKILLTMRLMYDEEREKLVLKKEVMLTIHGLVNRMISLGLLNKKPSNTELTQAMNELAGFQLVERIDGLWSNPETRFIIYPSILFVLTNAKLNELYSLIEEDEGERTEFETDEQMVMEVRDEDI